MTAVDLLWDHATTARDILSRSTPRMTREQYLAFQRGINRRELFDGMTRQVAKLS
jgi:hypothetical protein